MKKPTVVSRYAGVFVLATVIAVLPLLLPNSFYFDVAINGGIAAIVCVGLNLLIGYAGQISLGHAGFFALGAYSSAILTDNYGWPPIASLSTGLFVVGLLAFVIARPILRLKGHYLAMATLGMGIIISIVLNQEVNLTGGPDGMPVSAFSVFGWEVNSELAWYWIVGGSLIVIVLLALNLIDSAVGRALRAVHGSEVAAQVAGIDSTRYKILIFVVSAVMAAYAGSLFAHYTGFLTPSEGGFFRSIEFVTMVVLGGMASVFGSVIGAAILTALPQFLTVFHDYEHVMFGLVMMLTMIFMPKGLLPSLRNWISKNSL
ncbi:MAG: branched-chain amino acid ABC transporter permease [Gammaproteobacteria bacterium]|nr:branched-chain amino acid ABC transporter permease [Gammaproteobacteria bacterium]MDH3464726.1 branched-chain amino acid ABC transporter permease [Gammaproteobacteria bacterium]